jgi:hypothetical protein
MRPTAPWVLAIVAAWALAALVPDAAVAGPPNLDAKVSRHKSGPYKQELSINIAPGTAKNVYLKVKNNTGQRKDSLQLNQFEPEMGWNTRYFRRDQNITNEVQGGGYGFELGAGKAKKFRIRIKAPATTDDTCVTSLVEEMGPDHDVAVVGVNDPLFCTVPL